MDQIEIIHLRMKRIYDFESVKNQLKPVLKTLRKEISQTVRVYRRPAIESDLCIVLCLDPENSVCSSKDLGVTLAASLKAFGRVDHAVWVEMS